MAESKADRDARLAKRRERAQARYAANAELFKRRVSDYQKTNRAKINLRVRKRYAANPGKTLVRNRIRLLKSPEKAREQGRKRMQIWRAANLEKAKEAGRRARASMRGAYTAQRCGARRRGIAFLLTFEEWWTIWQQSGKWEQRGSRRDCYVMARFGDVGPYAIGNVRICKSGDNVREAMALRGPYTDDARRRISEAKARYWARRHHVTTEV